jgi:Zn finger protein HypA/HybF involved in hydrogenase expression
LLDDNIECRKCKKKFIPLGVKCPYCGKIFLRKITVKPVKVVCPFCKKRGQARPFLPEEKMHKASGLILCPNCQAIHLIG